MKAGFNVAVSRTLTPEQFAAAIGRLIPADLRIDVRARPPSDPDADIAATVDTSCHDPCWPCHLCCWWQSDATADALGLYPDVRLASELWSSYGVDCFCDVYPFAGDFDPHNPYWWLACVGGKWYLADMVEVPAVTGEASGSGIRLVRPVEIPGSPAAA